MPELKIEREPIQNPFFRTSEVHIYDGDSSKVKVLTVLDSSEDEMHVTMAEETEIHHPLSIFG